MSCPMSSLPYIALMPCIASMPYISGVYPGSISDKTIVQQSGLLNLLTVEDLVVADKGFLIQKNPCRELQ